MLELKLSNLTRGRESAPQVKNQIKIFFFKNFKSNQFIISEGKNIDDYKSTTRFSSLNLPATKAKIKIIPYLFCMILVIWTISI